MSLHINRFVDKIRATESRGQREVIMTINEAKDLQADITKLLSSLQEYHEKNADKGTGPETITVEMQGGTF
jgi:hypothetical protein